MANSIWQPSQKIKYDMFLSGQDITQVGSVEDVLEGGEDFDPDWRSVIAGDESTYVSLRRLAFG